MEENTRLSDLTRMLLSSPSFSGFLDNLSTNPAAIPQPQAPGPVEQRQVEARQVRKDINPYAGQQQMQQQHIGMTMIPEQTMDFSMLDLNGDGGYSYQPRVFSVLEMPEGPAIDVALLSEKATPTQSFQSDDAKIELPLIKSAPVAKEMSAPAATPVVDEEFDADPSLALFNDVPSTSSSTVSLDLNPIFGGIEPEKALARYELVDASASEAVGIFAMAKVQRICESVDDALERLEAMTVNY
jgi:hypothetical protein